MILFTETVYTVYIWRDFLSAAKVTYRISLTKKIKLQQTSLVYIAMDLRLKRSRVRISAVQPSGNNLGQVVYTYASVTKQYNLVTVKQRWCPEAGKVTIGLASHWPRVTALKTGRWAPRLHYSSGMAHCLFYLSVKGLHHIEVFWDICHLCSRYKNSSYTNNSSQYPQTVTAFSNTNFSSNKKMSRNNSQTEVKQENVLTRKNSCETWPWGGSFAPKPSAGNSLSLYKHTSSLMPLLLLPPPPLLLLLPFNGLFSRTTWLSWYQKGETSLDLNDERDDGVLQCSGISWTIYKQSAPHFRQITTPYPSTFRGNALPDARPTVSKHWRQILLSIFKHTISTFIQQC